MTEASVGSGQASMPPTYDEGKPISEDDVKVKIQSSNDAKIELGGKEKEAQEEGFKGLSKEELMQYANDPFWVRLRWSLFILFWIIWVAMLVVSIVIIVYAPKCPSPPPKQWWQKAPVFKVDVTKFPEGSLKGVEKEADAMVEAGVGTAYFPNLISARDFETVNQDMGTMDDWKSLVSELQKRGIRVMVDFQPWETADTHMWYEEAVSNKEPYNSYFLSGQKKLDLANAGVQEELGNLLKFWINEGVDGFMLQGAGTVPEALLANFRTLLDDAEAETTIAKVLVTEDSGWALAEKEEEEGAKYGGVGAGNPVHLILTEDLLGSETPTALGIKGKLDTFINTLPCYSEKKDEEVTETEEEKKPLTEEEQLAENVRILTAPTSKSCVWPSFKFNTAAFGEGVWRDALTMLKMLLPGTIITQPEELDLVSWAAQPLNSTDHERLSLYGLLASKLRHQEAILFGKLIPDINTFVRNSTVFGLTRVKKGSPGFLLLVNMGPAEKVLDVSGEATIPDSISVLEAGNAIASSPKLKDDGKRVSSSEVKLAQGQAKIFTFVPKIG